MHRMASVRAFSARAANGIGSRRNGFVSRFPPPSLVAVKTSLFTPSRTSACRQTWSSSLSRLYATKSTSLTAIFSKNRRKDRPFHLVIVESPSKCKTVSKILEQYVQDGDLPHDFVVASSMGHVRNLPRSTSKGKNETIVGVDIDNYYKPTYEILPGKHGLVQELQSLAKQAEEVVLATDDDREGEAVAWHLLQVLDDDITSFSRVTFTEITPTAIRNAMQHPSPRLNLNLVEAQETRRILDRLTGYTLSPILWRKIAPGLSAGRVQSVGMALVVQRERERLKFVSTDYYDLHAKFKMDDSKVVSASMVSLNDKPLATGTDFDNGGNLIKKQRHHIDTAKSAQDLVQAFTKDTVSWTVLSVKNKKRNENPPLPFTTSTLQQESNNRLGMSVSQTMRNAQSLYEAGFISYMRTDSTHFSNDAHNAIEQVVTRTHGSDKLATKRKIAKKKKSDKNTGAAPQKAHEAIRPAVQEDGSFLHPKQIASSDPSAIKLYELIYQRTLASRMTPLVTNQTTVDILGQDDNDQTAIFRALGSTVLDPGHTLAMSKSANEKFLPPLVEGQELARVDLQSANHATLPPPRYTEASFVKELEALGVGRPSTYAHTVQVLRDRAYVGTPLRAISNNGYRKKETSGSAISAHRAAGGEEFTGGGRGPLVPSLSAFVVCSLLEKNCPTYVDPTFTAGMEERLDEIALGVDTNENSRVAYLDEFYAGENGLAAQVNRIDREVAGDEARRAELPALFLDSDDDEDIGLFIGPWGPYVQKVSNNTKEEKPPTAPLPPGMAADLSTITIKTLRALLSSKESDGLLLGTHPEDGRDIRLKVGRYGAYLQWGEDGVDTTTTHSLPKHIGGMRNLDFVGDETTAGGSLGTMIGLTLEDAVGYVSLPRTVCTMNDKPIVASIGPYGPYLKYNNSFVSLYEKDGNVLTVDAETAERVVTDGIINKSSGLARGVIAELGEKDGGMVRIRDGRFGVYINWKKVNAKLPAEYSENPSDLQLDEAWGLIQEKLATSSRSKASGEKPKSSRGKSKPKKESETSDTDDLLELPPAPKRPLSAYLHFCAEKRPEVSKSIKSLGDVSKELSRLWAETDPERVGNSDLRKPYDDLAAQSKREYDENMKAWKKECQKLMGAVRDVNGAPKNGTSKKNGARKKTGTLKKKSSVLDAKTSSAAPKKPRSAYLYFCSAKRPEVSKKFKKLGDVSKELARLWAETETDGGEGRHEYEELAAADKVRYEEEMLRYKAGAL